MLVFEFFLSGSFKNVKKKAAKLLPEGDHNLKISFVNRGEDGHGDDVFCITISGGDRAALEKVRANLDGQHGQQGDMLNTPS